MGSKSSGFGKWKLKKLCSGRARRNCGAIVFFGIGYSYSEIRRGEGGWENLRIREFNLTFRVSVAGGRFSGDTCDCLVVGIPQSTTVWEMRRCYAVASVAGNATTASHAVPGKSYAASSEPYDGRNGIPGIGTRGGLSGFRVEKFLPTIILKVYWFAARSFNGLEIYAQFSSF
ncbi:MAG: hypothetical protein O3C43_24930 [Verrucomicrobia bacterium]|nr:hypothetical protein [Verrucomicrobiota bacterium]